jgi:hypothetical protein
MLNLSGRLESEKDSLVLLSLQSPPTPPSPPTPDYSPGDFGYPSPGDWDSDYDTDQ